MSIYVGAGPLRTLAELQRKVQARTAAGGTEVTWVKERDIWCRIKGLSPRLKLEAMAREAHLEVSERATFGEMMKRLLSHIDLGQDGEHAEVSYAVLRRPATGA